MARDYNEDRLILKQGNVTSINLNDLNTEYNLLGFHNNRSVFECTDEKLNVDELKVKNEFHSNLSTSKQIIIKPTSNSDGIVLINNKNNIKISVKKCTNVPKNILKMFNERKSLGHASSNSVLLNRAVNNKHPALAKPIRTYEKRKDKITYPCPNIDNPNTNVNKDPVESNVIEGNIGVNGNSSDCDKKKIEIRTVDIRKLTGKKLIDGVAHKVSADQIKQFLNGTSSKNFIVLKSPLERRKTTDCSEIQLLKDVNRQIITANDCRLSGAETKSTPTPESSTSDTLDVNDSELPTIVELETTNIDNQIGAKEGDIEGDSASNNLPIFVQNKFSDVEEIIDVTVNREPETRKATEMGKIKHFKEKSSTASHNTNNETTVVSRIFSDTIDVSAHYTSGNTTDTNQQTWESKKNSEDDILLRNKRRIHQRSAALQKRYIQQEIEKCLKAKMKTRKKKLKTAQCQTEIKCRESWTQTIDFQAEDVPAITTFNSGDHHIYYSNSNFEDILVADVNLGSGPKLEPYRIAGETVTYNVGNNLENLVGNCNIPPSRLVNVNAMGYLDVDNVHGDMSGIKTRDNKHAFQEYLRNCIIADTAGNLPLHIEVMKNEFNEVRRQLVMLNVWRLSIDTTNANHLTPLHLAVIHNCDENIVSFLLDKGADIGCTDSEGNNSMHLAVFHNSQPLLHLLLQKASDTNFNFNNTFNYEGFTPLLLATIEDKLDMVRTFLEFEADPNIRDQKSGRTPLFHAVENNNMIMVQLLLHHGADKKIKNFSGTSTHDAVFELEGISADIKNMIIGKEIFAVNSTRTDKRKKPSVDKTKEVCTKKLRTVKTYRKINMQ